MGGKYQDSDSTLSATCKFCAKGFQFVDEDKARSACPTGKYQDSESTLEAECKFCAKGFEFVNAQSACSACQGDTYQDENDKASAQCKAWTDCGVVGKAVEEAGSSIKNRVCCVDVDGDGACDDSDDCIITGCSPEQASAAYANI